MCWQMITVTGAKGVAANPEVTPEKFAVSMAAGFKKACPETFAVKPFGVQIQFIIEDQEPGLTPNNFQFHFDGAGFAALVSSGFRDY